MAIFEKVARSVRGLSRPLVAGILTATAILVGLTAVSAQPVSASPASCSPTSNNGFHPIPYNRVGDPADTDNNPVVLYGTLRDGVMVRLEYGMVQVGSSNLRGVWARLYNSGPPLVERDKVWMDWKQNNPNSWLQCGPFEAGGKQSMTTPAQIDAGFWDEFRACAQLLGEQPRCTDWWRASSLDD